LVEFVLEPLIRHGAIAKILVDMGSAVDDAHKAMLLKHLAAEASPGQPKYRRGSVAPFSPERTR
jgi:hypothetical protein